MQRDTASEYTTIPLGNRFRRGAKQFRVWFWEWTKTEAALYVLVGVILSLVAIHALWKPGYIAGGDIWPGGAIPGNVTLRQSLALWGTSTTGFGSPQYNPTGVFWGILEQSLLWLRFSGPQVEFVTLAVPFVAEGLAVAWFVRTMFPSSRSAAVAAGLGLPLSLYSTLMVGNTDFVFDVAYAAWSAAWLWHRMQEPISPWRLAGEIGIASLGFMVLVSPPPVAVWTMVWMVGWVALGAWRFRTLRKTWMGLMAGTSFAALINGWWLYAAWLTLYGSGGSVRQTFANPFAWAWVDSRASLMNLLSMQAGWSWPQVLYYPWANLFGHGVLHWALYFPALFAVLGLIWHPFVYRKKWLLGGIVVVCLFVAQGLHPPASAINTWLYVHVPFYWLLRDPQVEADISLYLSLFVLAGLGVESVALRLQNSLRFTFPERQDAGTHGLRRFLFSWVSDSDNSANKCSSGARTGLGLTLLGTAVICVSGYTLWTGTVIPHKELNGQATPVVHVPAYWKRAASFLNVHSHNQRVLLLPNDNFYQVPYRWGYYGTDSVAQSLIKAALVMVAPNAGGYFGASGANVAFQNQLKHTLAQTGNRSLVPVLRALNVGWILERGDVVWNAPGRHILSPAQIRRALSGQPGLRLARRFGPLRIYRVVDPYNLVQAYHGVGQWISSNTPPLFEMNHLTREVVPWVMGQRLRTTASVVGLSEPPNGSPPNPIKVPIGGRLIISPRTVSVDVEWLSSRRVSVLLVGPTVRLGTQKNQWREQTVFNAPLPLRRRWALQLGSRTFLASEKITRVHQLQSLGTFVVPGQDMIPAAVWESAGINRLADTRWSALGDCNAYNSEKPSEAGLSAEYFGKSGVVLRAISHAACVTRRTELSLSKQAAALVTIGAEGQPSAPPQVRILWNNRVVASLAGIANSKWQNLWRWVPLLGRGTLTVFTYANGNGVQPVVDKYRRPTLTIMHPLGSAIIHVRPNGWPVSPGTMSLHYPRGKSTNLVSDATFRNGLWNTPFNANLYTRMTNSQAGLQVRPSANGAVLTARYEAVGEAQTIPNVAGQIIQVSMQARSVDGNPPVAALLGPKGQPLWDSSFVGGYRGWQSRSSTVRVPTSIQAVSLVLYAYGSGSITKDQYKRIRITKWNPGASQIDFIGGKAPKPLAVAREGSSSVVYHLTLPRGARLLLLAKSYAVGWGIESPTHQLKWRHVAVDGWLNGWLVPTNRSPVSRQITIYYRPAIAYRFLQRLAIVGTLIGIVGVGLSILERRRSNNLSTKSH